MITFRPRAFTTSYTSRFEPYTVPANSSIPLLGSQGPARLKSLTIITPTVAGLQIQYSLDYPNTQNYAFRDSILTTNFTPDMYADAMQNDSMFTFSSNAVNTQKVVQIVRPIESPAGFGFTFINTTGAGIQVIAAAAYDVQFA